MREIGSLSGWILPEVKLAKKNRSFKTVYAVVHTFVGL